MVTPRWSARSGRPDRLVQSSAAADAFSSAAPFLVAAAALALIGNTLMPGLGFWDTGEFQSVGPVLGTAHPTGFPSYVILGWVASLLLAPAGEPAFRMNLLSALLVAAAAGLTVVLIGRLTRSTLLGVAGGFGLAATPIAWGVGRHADPHALHLALVALLLVLLVGWEQARHGARTDNGRARTHNGRAHTDNRAETTNSADRWLVAAAFVFGISLANHSLTLLLIPPVGLYVLAVDPRIWRRPRLVATCALVVVATTAALYLELPLRAGPFRAPLVYAAPDTWDGFSYVVLAEQFRGSLIDPFGDLAGKFRALVDLTVVQLGPLAALIPAGFLATILRRPRYALLSGLAALITCSFAASYDNADIGRYYLVPALMAWTWLAILAAAAIDQVGMLFGAPPAEGEAAGIEPRRRTSAVRAAAAFVLAAILVLPTGAVLGARATLLDESRNTAARTWVDAALAAMAPDAVVVTWWSYSTPLWYAQRVEGRRPDISIVDDRTRLDLNLGGVSDVIDQHLGRKPVYLVRSSEIELRTLGSRYRLVSVTPNAANLLLVAGRVTGTP